MAADRQTLETIARRAATLVYELSGFTNEEYPPETTALRDVLTLVAQYLADLIEDLKATDDYFETTKATHIQQIARSLNELFAMLRYLRASATLTSPPALHAVVNCMVSGNFAGGTHLTVVRPQWEYNCKFVNLSYELSKILIDRLAALSSSSDHLLGTPHLVVPSKIAQKKNRLDAAHTVLRLMAQRAGEIKGESALAKRVCPPSEAIHPFIGILSIAGIDKGDVLLYPMMAHEVAHFIAYSRPLPEHLTITAKLRYTKSTFESAVAGARRPVAESELAGLARILTKKIEICVRELLADVVAIRMLGAAYFFGLIEFLKGLHLSDDPLVSPESNYPSMRLRLALAYSELETLPDVHALLSREDAAGAYRTLKSLLLQWKNSLNEMPAASAIDLDPDAEVDDHFLHLLSTNAVLRGLKDVLESARRLIPDAATSIDETLEERVQLLRHRLPPLVDGSNQSIALILSAAWIHRSEQSSLSTLEYERNGRLVIKAIELADSNLPQTEPDERPVRPPSLHKGVVTGEAIIARSKLPLHDDSRISVIPLRVPAIETASLDVHLGNWFKLSRRPKMAQIDLQRAREFLRTGVLHDEFFIEDARSFILHSGDFALGITQEFIGMPRNAMAFVEGKSSLGRTGLIVATATQVAPGFHGCIVLELANTGTIPLSISPGMRIAQLVIVSTSHPVRQEWLYNGDFDCQIKP